LEEKGAGNKELANFDTNISTYKFGKWTKNQVHHVHSCSILSGKHPLKQELDSSGRKYFLVPQREI
jgi:hypothetical protein